MGLLPTIITGRIVDEALVGKNMELLIKLNEKLGKTVLVVTHEQSLVRQYNKRVITIGEGGIASDVPAKSSGNVISSETAPAEPEEVSYEI